MALSEKITAVISFLSGVIVTNGVGALFQGELFVSMLSFLTVAVVVFLKKFIDWDTKETG